MTNSNLIHSAVCAGLFTMWVGASASPVVVDMGQLEAAAGSSVIQDDLGDVRATWEAGEDVVGELLLNLNSDEPLIRTLGLAREGQPVSVIASQLDPVILLTVGERDPEKASQACRGMVFFENPRNRPYQTHRVLLAKRWVRVSSEGSRTTIRVGEVTAGSFRGDLQFTLFRNSPLICVEAVVTTDEALRAILYDGGMTSQQPDWSATVWMNADGGFERQAVREEEAALPLAVKSRVIATEGTHGSFAVFPAPHQYFYPLDFADNFKFAWFGRDYRDLATGFGLGIRQPIEGDKRWVPWFDAPAGTDQRLRMYVLLSLGDGEEVIGEVAKYTRKDRFKELPGFKTLTSHYHVEHTVDYLDRQKRQGTNGIPTGLETPGFVTKFKDTGIDIVHLAEFHYGWTPGQKTADRLRMLQRMHEECARLSDDEFLLLPGEEPNVHLGGHWMSFFPKPVYWVLNRGEAEPFVEERQGYGMVYHVGNADEVLELMEREDGLMWTAHARIKGSREYPDGYQNCEFYASDHFMGAAWKAMPADLSRPTLGWRILDLLDDMNQVGSRKQVLGEVDVFRVEPDYELYAHMNINYLKLDTLPKFQEGWQPILDGLRGGQFFTTTGEILIPRFTVSGHESGDTLAESAADNAVVEAELEWTFPLAFAEVVSGDGREVYRERIKLSDSEGFGSRTLRVPVDLTGHSWVRFEIWDVAANGAFTQPVWISR